MQYPKSPVLAHLFWQINALFHNFLNNTKIHFSYIKTRVRDFAFAMILNAYHIHVHCIYSLLSCKLLIYCTPSGKIILIPFILVSKQSYLYL